MRDLPCPCRNGELCLLVLRWQSEVVLIAVYVLWAAAILSIFVRWPYRVTSESVPTEAALTVHANSQSERLPIGEYAFKALQLAVPLYLITSVAMPKEIPWDAGMIAAGLLVAVVGSMVAGRWNGVGGAGGSVCREHLPDVLQ